MKDFFSFGKVLNEINHTLIALISKVHNPKQTNHFRPISLHNTIYKIISKITVHRMHTILERIIQPTQSAMVSHRSIHDNVLVAHKILNKFHFLKGKRGYVALKLDMEKTHDRVERGFLFSCLTEMGS